MQKRLVRCPKCKNAILRIEGNRYRIFNRRIDGDVQKGSVEAVCRCGTVVSLKKYFSGKHILLKKSVA